MTVEIITVKLWRINIVTDTSAAPMAPMMSVAASPPTQALTEIRATDKIWVFGNGLKGSGVMGFQPAIFGSLVLLAANLLKPKLAP